MSRPRNIPMNLSYRCGIALRIAALAVGLTIGTGGSADSLARLREMTATTLLSRPASPCVAGRTRSCGVRSRGDWGSGDERGRASVTLVASHHSFVCQRCPLGHLAAGFCHVTLIFSRNGC